MAGLNMLILELELFLFLLQLNLLVVECLLKLFFSVRRNAACSTWFQFRPGFNSVSILSLGVHKPISPYLKPLRSVG